MKDITSRKTEWVITITVIFLLVIQLIPFSFAEQSTTLKSSVEKIVFYKQTSAFGTMQEKEKSALFHIHNIGNSTAIDVSLITTEFTLAESTQRIVGNGQFNRDFLIVEPERLDIERSQVLNREVFSIENGTGISVKVTLKNLPADSGKYNGSIMIVGQNFEPLTLKIEANILHNPIELAVFTLFGLFLATLMGLWFTISEGDKPVRSSTGNNAIVSHIRGHTFNLNQIRKAFDPTVWKRIEEIHKLKRKKIIQLVTKGGKLDPNAEAVKWYEEKVKELVKKNITNKDDPNGNNNKPLLDITEKDIEISLPEEVKIEIKKPSKIIFAVLAVAAAIPLTLFAQNYFMGNPVIDVFIAMGIGFLVYRTKDIEKIITDSKPKEEKS